MQDQEFEVALKAVGLVHHGSFLLTTVDNIRLLLSTVNNTDKDR